MIVRVRERRSRLAYWSWRLALLAAVVFIAATFTHRTDAIDTPQFYTAMSVAIALALAALFAALAALEQIWRDGRQGMRLAVRGLILAVLLLAAPAYAALQVVTLPRVADVSTDVVRPPAFAHDPSPVGHPGLDASAQSEGYPDILTREYPLDSRRVFEEARKLVVARRWDVVNLGTPTATQPAGTIEATARTFPFGFREDIALRFEPDGTGTRVDMRSASRYGAHDMGSNAERVRKFLGDLDAAVAALTGGGT